MCCGREWIQPGELVQGWSWDGGLLDGPRVSLKSGFQLNPWLSSKRTRKMTEVHDMARSPHPAKPFHFGPFVSLQLLIFMIAPPDITPTSGLPPPPHRHHNRKKKKTGWDLKTTLAEWRARVRPWGFTAQCNIENIWETSIQKAGVRWGQKGRASRRGRIQRQRRRQGRRQRNNHSRWNTGEANIKQKTHILCYLHRHWLISFFFKCTVGIHAILKQIPISTCLPSWIKSKKEFKNKKIKHS